MIERLRYPRWFPSACLAIAGGSALFVVRHVDPTAANSPLPPCPLYALTGLYCPGCGSTRCLHALAFGDLHQAMSMNPLLVVSLPILALMALSAAGIRMRWFDPILRIAAQPKVWLVLLLGHMFLRNLPWFPFTLLAPG